LVYDCFKDSAGFLWIGTNNGLSRFNGQKFETYGPREGVLGNEVINIRGTSKGFLGFYINGCFLTDGNKFKDVSSTILKNLDVSAITYVEEQDSMLIVSSLSYTYYFNKRTLSLLRTDGGYKLITQKKKNNPFYCVKTADILSKVVAEYDTTETIRMKAPANKKQFAYLGSQYRGWIYAYDRNESELKKLYDSKKPLTSFFLASDSSLYICNQRGLFVVDWKRNIEIPIIEGSPFNTIYEDNDGVLWASSVLNGLYRIKKNDIIIFRKSYQNSFPPVHCIGELQSGGIVLGNNDGSVTYFSSVSQKTKYISSTPSRNRVINIYPFYNKHLFFTDNFISDENGNLFAPNYCNKHVSYYSKNDVLISNCSESYLFSLVEKKTISVLYSGRSIVNLVKRDKKIFIATPTQLLYKKNLKEKFKPISLEPNIQIKVTLLAEDTKSRLWVGTEGWGLYVLDENQTIIKALNKNNILESDNIKSLFIDSTNKVWIGTDKGIMLLTENEEGEFKTSKPFSDLDLKNNIISSIYSYRDTVYFATSNEFLACIYKNHSIARTINVSVKSVFVNDSISDFSKKVFSPYENNIKIQLECPLVNSNESPAYFFKLEDNNTNKINNWQKTTSNSLAFNSLAPGKYTLSIKAEDPAVSNSNSNVLSWTFIIEEHFYKTWWFYTLVIFAIFSILFGVYFFYNKQKQNRIQKELEADAKINELKLQGLLSQMNPHFLFNSLNVIQKFITSNDDINALTHLSDFSDLMRESLDQTRRGHISLEDEFLFLEQYVNLEKKRFDNDFIFCIHNEIDDDLSDIIIPPMLIQPLVENAIKHGVANMKSPQGEIHVTFRLLHHSLLQVCIRDNGNQRSSSRTDRKKKESHALNIIQERVELIKHGDFSGKFDIKIDEVGATAILNIPIV